MVEHVPDGRPSEHTRFVEAVLAFAADPGPANVERYLAASRALGQSQLLGGVGSGSPAPSLLERRYDDERQT